MPTAYKGLRPRLLESVRIEGVARLKRGVQEYSTQKNLQTVAMYTESVNGYLDDLEEKLMENQALQQGSYTMGIGVTRNMGNYESLNVTIHVNLPILVDPNSEASASAACLTARNQIEKIIEEHLPQMISDGSSAFRIPMQGR